MAKDYSIYDKEEVNLDSLPNCDLFLSAFTSSGRVRDVYAHSPARRKRWVIFPEYGYGECEFPRGAIVLGAVDEAEAGMQYLPGMLDDARRGDICVDITGFPRAHLVFLLRWLVIQGVKVIRLLYTEPEVYAEREKTSFYQGNVIEVRQIRGCEGVHIADTSQDILVIAAGYDHELIKYAAESKNNARKIQILGLPALRPEMYQENVLRAKLASEAVGGEIAGGVNTWFAPANDPFVTADVVSRIVDVERGRGKVTNTYLCPLSTKPQVVGMTLFFLWEALEGPSSIIFPITSRYSRETSKGHSRVWVYTVELP